MNAEYQVAAEPKRPAKVQIPTYLPVIEETDATG